MIDLSKKNLIEFSLGLFFSLPLEETSTPANLFKQEYNDIFDLDPINIAVPPEVIDYPESKLRSKSKFWSFDLSKTRADFRVSFEISESKEEKISKCEDMLQTFYDIITGLTFGVDRVTTIMKFAIDSDNPAQDLYDKLLKEKKEGVSEFNLTINTPYQDKYNNIVSYQTGRKTSTKDVADISSVMIVTRDFNTIPQNEMKLSKDDIKEFVSVYNQIILK